MKVLIRDKTLNLYLASGNRWVTDADEGWDFQVGIAAIDYARLRGLTDVDLWYVFPNLNHNFSIPFEALKPNRVSKSATPPTPVRSSKGIETTTELSTEMKRRVRLTKLWFKLEELDGTMQSTEMAYLEAKRKLRRSHGSE